MGYFYAELDENNRCKAVSELSGEVIKDTMIQLEFFDESLLGKEFCKGEWLETNEEVEEEIIVKNENVEEKIKSLEDKLNQILSLLQQ